MLHGGGGRGGAVVAGVEVGALGEAGVDGVRPPPPPVTGTACSTSLQNGAEPHILAFRGRVRPSHRYRRSTMCGFARGTLALHVCAPPGDQLLPSPHSSGWKRSVG